MRCLSELVTLRRSIVRSIVKRPFKLRLDLSYRAALGPVAAVPRNGLATCGFCSTVKQEEKKEREIEKESAVQEITAADMASIDGPASRGEVATLLSLLKAEYRKPNGEECSSCSFYSILPILFFLIYSILLFYSALFFNDICSVLFYCSYSVMVLSYLF